MKTTVIFLILLFLTLVSASCGGSHEKQLAQGMSALQVADLHPKEIKVTSFQEQGKDEALMEADIHTAFLMKKNARGEWKIQSIRLGDRRWENAKFFAAALDQAKEQGVKQDFDKLTAAIEKYQADKKELPPAQNIAELNDALYPAYMPQILRLDPWSTEYEFQPTSRHNYVLLSAGPDRKFGTADDIRETH